MIQRGSKPKINLDDISKNVNRDKIIDSLQILLIHGLITKKVIVIPEITPDQNNLLKFCSEQELKERQLDDLGYLDEMLSLKVGKINNKPVNYLNTRFDPREFSYLPALQFDEYEHS